jgi:hypothetical protein
MAKGVIEFAPTNVRDWNSHLDGMAQCEFCFNNANTQNFKDVEHDSDCIYLIAKDVMTGN